MMLALVNSMVGPNAAALGGRQSILSPAFVGDSQVNFAVYQQSEFRNTCLLDWLRFLLDSKIEPVADTDNNLLVFATAGVTSGNAAISQHITDVCASAATHVFFQGNTNDALNGTNAATLAATVLAYAQQVRTAGKRFVFIAAYPIPQAVDGNGSWALSDNVVAQNAATVAALEADDFLCLDCNSVIENGTVGRGDPDYFATDDPVGSNPHLAPYGAEVLARAYITAIEEHFRFAYNPLSNEEYHTTNADFSAVTDANPVFRPTGFTPVNPGYTKDAETVVTDSEGVWWRMEFSDPSYDPNDYIQLISPSAIESPAGKRMDAICKVRVQAGRIYPNGFYLRDETETPIAYDMYGSDPNWGGIGPEDGTKLLRTPVVTIGDDVTDVDITAYFDADDGTIVDFSLMTAREIEPAPPVITGTPNPGETLTSTRALQWYLNGVAVEGETGLTFVIPLYAVEGDEITQTGSNVIVVEIPSALPGSPVAYWRPTTGYDATTRAIENEYSDEPLSANLIRFPIRSWTAGVWTRGGDTAWASATDSAGNSGGARRIALAGSTHDKLVTAFGFVPQTGQTYTLVVKCKSNVGGVPQDVPLGGEGAPSTGVYSVGDSWTRLAHTFTGSGSGYQPGIYFQSADDAIDILVESIELFKAASDPGQAALGDGHLYLDRFGNNNTAVVDDGYLACPSTFACAQLPFDTASDEYTVCGVVRHNPAIVATDTKLGFFEDINDSNCNPMFNHYGCPFINQSVALQGSNVVSQANHQEMGYDWPSYGWQHVAIKYGGGIITFYLDGYAIWRGATGTGELPLRDLRIASFFGNPTGAEFSNMVLYNTAIADADVLEARDVQVAHAIADGITMGPTLKVVTWEGHSWNAEKTWGPQWQVHRDLDEPSVSPVFATGGSFMTMLEGRLPYLLACLRPGVVLNVTIGTNDFPTSGGNSGHTSAFNTAFNAWALDVMETGAYVQLELVSSRSNPFNSTTVDTTFNSTFRNPVNTAWRAPGFVGTYCSKILDVDTKSYGGDTACSDTDIMYDGWHLTQTEAETVRNPFWLDETNAAQAL